MKLLKQIGEAAIEIMKQKDVLMRAAINHQLGWEWKIEELKDRVDLTILPGGKVEIFSVDNVPLLEFQVAPNTAVEFDEADGVRFISKLNYRKLYKEKTLLS